MMDVKTLSEFIEWAAQFNDGQYLFRGVPKYNYKIQASAYRRLPKRDGNNPSKLLKINQVLIEKARSLGHDQKNGQQLSDLELLAELQHFGAATCLIDFTRNALSALWFACQQSSKGKANGKVFAVRSDDPARFKTVNTELIKKNIDYFFQLDENNNRYSLYQWQPKLQNNRIIAQQSVFVFGGAQIETEAECVITECSKKKILNSLDKLSSINEASIYPDFDGFARLHAHNKPHIEPDAQGYLQRGVEAHQNNNLDDAITYYTEVISLDSDISTVSKAYCNLGTAYINKGEPDLAIENLNKAIDLNSSDFLAYNSRGFAYNIKGEINRAIEDFNKAIELDPDNVGIYKNCGLAYIKKGAYVCAIEKYNKAIELDSNDANAYYNRGNAYYAKGAYDQAIADYNNAIVLNPRFAQAYHNRGNAYYVKGAYDQAIADYNNAIALNPDEAQAYHNRGMCWLHLQNWQGARSDLTIANSKGMDIIAAFRNGYKNVGEFERRYSVKLPEEIAAMLTPPR